MKRILYLTALALLFIITSTTTSKAEELVNNSREITLTVTQDDTRDLGQGHDVEPDDIKVPRSIILQPAYAYLYNNVVSLDFTETFSAVIVTITNNATGETVYSETCSNPATLNIDLSSESSGNYLIEIEADDTRLEGNFSL
ncbi:DUF3244 domain-containing protein [Bacteroides sp. GD17]|jgi:hypothetical protein|uniref:DUF3244 domain-containing protein n=1 Tax=Bacteroides sp. GD17 TaxID=3139826 RepID=UPI0025CE37A9|nr:DUF3244 domain-containing protein [uncultured Bacteroides sp.]